jgi:hypothetical protein
MGNAYGFLCQSRTISAAKTPVAILPIGQLQRADICQSFQQGRYCGESSFLKAFLRFEDHSRFPEFTLNFGKYVSTNVSIGAFPPLNTFLFCSESGTNHDQSNARAIVSGNAVLHSGSFASNKTGPLWTVPLQTRVVSMVRKQNWEQDERSAELRGDERARADELGEESGEVGPSSAGQSGDQQRLSRVADADEESVEELADTEQAFEAAAVEGVEDAADHPERPVHTHEEYGRPEDLPPQRRDDEEAA